MFKYSRSLGAPRTCFALVLAFWLFPAMNHCRAEGAAHRIALGSGLVLTDAAASGFGLGPEAGEVVGLLHRRARRTLTLHERDGFVRSDEPSQPRQCVGSMRLPWGRIDTCEEAILAASAGTVGLIGYVKWWRKGFGFKWRTNNEGWFGRGTYAGGVDKLSHGYSLYVGTRLLTRSLDWAGGTHERSIGTAAVVGLSAALIVEVFDALSKRAYGFSKEDLISGALGVGAAALMEAHPKLDQFVAYRMMYKSPILPRSFPQPLDDYDRQIYLVALRLSGFRIVGPRSPLRYVELIAGYGATGFLGTSAASSDTRSRTIYLGVGIDLTQVAHDLFSGTNGGPALAFTTEAFRYLQPPGTSILSKSKF